MAAHQPIVNNLLQLMLQNPALKGEIEAAIARAELADIPDIDSCLSLMNRMITTIPAKTNQLLLTGLDFYYIIDQSEELKTDGEFQEWVYRFAIAIGEFMNSPESAAILPQYYWDPQYSIGEYTPGPSGWLSFNQFFARQVRAGQRPVARPLDPKTIAFPCDCEFMGKWPIDKKDKVTIKNVELSIGELMHQSRFATKFKGGLYSHMYLHISNYHRFHSPVAGKVVEVCKIPGKVGMDVVKNEEGQPVAKPGTGFQFVQDRGIIVIQGALGYVAMIPVGMAQISSVNFSVDVGVEVQKGEEVGFFQFGGSDIILLFDTEISLEAKAPEPGQLTPIYMQGAIFGAYPDEKK